MKVKLTEKELSRIINKVISESEDFNMDVLRKSVQGYKEKNTPISKKTGEPVKTHAVPFHGYYNISEKDLPLNVKSFYNSFKKNLGVFNIKPSKNSKEEILDVLEKILTLNGFN